MTRWLVWLSIAWVAGLAAATPTVAFPFNSQVPAVARKNEQYNYQLSGSTFTYTGSVAYSISQQPAWLSIDSKSLTLSGRPGDSDVGSATFTITATDSSGAAHMACTLVVSGEPAPQIQGDLTQQLASEVNLTSTDPVTITLTPGTHFDFDFKAGSFVDSAQNRLYYYSTLIDHTPLPSWLSFNAERLSFTGTAPTLSGFPQSWTVSLMASDYVGFSGVSSSFTIIIATQQLTIVPSVQTVHVTPGSTVKYSLAQAVYLDGKQIPASDLKSATATIPSWATFDAKSLTISGSVPQGESSDTGSVSVVDASGDIAQASLRFVTGNDTLFTGNIGTITATAGQDLQYTIPSSVLADSNANLTLLVPANATWLRLDPDAHVIHGLVPANASSSTLEATLQASAPGAETQSQTFSIDIKASSDPPGSAATSAAGSAGPSSSRSSGLSDGSIAAIVIGSVLGAAIILAILLLCCRRRRRQREYVDRDTPSPTKRRLISGPTLLIKPDNITVTTQVHTDVEKAEERESADEDLPPQIALEIPAPHVRSTRLGARESGLSQASSIGQGEDAIRRDANIPEWGQESSELGKPHDSFSIPTIIARGPKRLRSMSPSKRALRRSKQSIGLGIDTSGGSVKQHRKSGRVKNKTSNSGLSATLERSSCASLSTQATSLLSTKPSDFPRPPTQSTFSHGSRSIPTLSYVEPGNRRSVRLIGRSDSSIDSRPMQLKRESFIRARASTSLQSPLFSHGSRGPLEPRSGRGSSSDNSSSVLDRWRARRRALKSTTSQSSFAISEGDSRRLSQRVRSAFAPNFPRVVSGSEYEDDYREAIDDDLDEAWEDVTPSVSRHQSANNLAAEMAKPRHLRSWVLPGEASPTPPPPSLRKAGSDARSRWKTVSRSDRSSSPLATTAMASIEQEMSPAIPKKSPKRRQSYINEPIGLVSKDSLSGIRDEAAERPRLGNISSSRPVSVENVDRLSSLKAETMDARGGGELDDDELMQGAGLTGPDGQRFVGTQKSQMSGTAFL